MNSFDNISIALATFPDAADVGRMIEAMDLHYRGAGQTSGVAAATAMATCALSEFEGTRFLLARRGPKAGLEPVGIACFAIIRPGTRLSGLIFLKDLFVPAAHRGRGIGHRLMSALAAYALDNDIGRIDLMTAHDNTGAQRLYATLGGAREDKIQYRFDAGALPALASRIDPGSTGR